MLKLFSLILLLITITLCVSIRIQTRLGAIEGTERKSRDGNTYYAFTKVPYAKPPLNELRLKNPVRVERWQGVLKATEESPMCLQFNLFIHNFNNLTLGQEDCLYLSIYTPDLEPQEKLAVIVRIHGGGFRCGSAGPANNPDYLIDGNVILVNVHYRLGTLGFLSTEDTVIPGNFGLKDQAMAIQWVKQNIEDFGGDNERIIVIGNSAGGASAHYHMLSPLTKGLIKGAISQSGVVNPFWAISAPGKARNLARKIGNIVGCSQENSDELLKCLQNTCPTKLIQSEDKLLYWESKSTIALRPVQEPLAEGAFLTFDPLKAETTLPWMTGMVSNEGVFRSASLETKDDSVTQSFIDNMDQYLMYQLSLDTLGPKEKESIELIKLKYFPEARTLSSVQKGDGQLFTDLMMTYPMAKAIGRHKGPLYQYYYDYMAGSSFTDLLGYKGERVVCHMDELITLYNETEVYPKKNPDEEQVSRTMVKLWTNFAKYQKPTMPEDKVQWPKYNVAQQYLHITNSLSVKRHLKADVIQWWYKLPLSSSLFVNSEL